MKLVKCIGHPLGMGAGAGTCVGSGTWADAGAAGFDASSVGANRPKLWIAAAIGAGLGLATSLIGGAQASNAAEEAEKEAERRQREQEAKENAWYLRRYNEDYVDTAAGQNLVRRAKEFAKENWKKAAGAQAVAGGTEAATAMAKEAGNKMVGDTIANIAATDQQRKEQVDNMHRQAESQFAQMDINRVYNSGMRRAQNITNAAQGASNAIMSAAGAIEQGISAKAPTTNPTTSLTGGSNNGTQVTATPSTNGMEIIGYDGMGNPLYRNGGVV